VSPLFTGSLPIFDSSGEALEEAASTVQDRKNVRVLFVPLAAVGFAFALVTAATELIKAEPPPAPAATSIVWADRVFSSKHDLARWLKSRGATYDEWSAHHPAASSVLERARTQKVASPSAFSAQPELAGRGDSKNVTLAVSILALSVVGVLALLLALRVTFPRLALRKTIRRPARLRRHRDARPSLAPVTSKAFGVGSLVPRWRSAGHGAAGGGRSGAVIGARRIDVLVPLAALRSRLARRVAGARIGWRLPGRRATNYDAGVSDYESMLAREAVRRYMPDIALYVSSVLLACVVGASIALYLN